MRTVNTFALIDECIVNFFQKFYLVFFLVFCVCRYNDVIFDNDQDTNRILKTKCRNEEIKKRPYTISSDSIEITKANYCCCVYDKVE